MKSDKITFMLWSFDKKQTLNSAIEESIKYFRNKYKDYTYAIKEIRVRTGMLSDAENNLYDGISIKTDSTIFSDKLLYVVFS